MINKLVKEREAENSLRFQEQVLDMFIYGHEHKRVTG